MTVNAPPRLDALTTEIARAQDAAKLKFLERAVERLTGELAEIFDGIARGEHVELAYPDGSIITITRARNRGGDAK